MRGSTELEDLSEMERSFSLSAFASLLRSGEFVVTAELNPPKSAAANVVRRRGEALKGVVDAVNVTDSNRAVVAMAAIPAATIVRSSGVEPIVQITGRDRNRIALQADLLGAVAIGIENFVFMSGEEPIIAGVLVLRSAEQAERMAKVPGLALGTDVLERMKKAGDAEAEGIAIAVEMVKALKALPGVRGVHLYAIEWPEAVGRVVEAAGLLPRPQAKVAV